MDRCSLLFASGNKAILNVNDVQRVLTMKIATSGDKFQCSFLGENNLLKHLLHTEVNFTLLSMLCATSILVSSEAYSNKNTNNGYFYVLFRRRAHSYFMENGENLQQGRPTD